MQEIRLTIPRFGYRIETRQRKVNPDQALTVLTKARQQKITYAVQDDHTVTIARHVIVCLACGKETPAYAEFTRSDERSFKGKSQAELEEWMTRQLSLFGEQPQKLLFNTPVKGLRHFRCPHCGALLSPSEHSFDVVIGVKNRKIKVLRKLTFGDYFSIGWLKGFQMSACDLYETITFNLRNGHTYVSLESDTGIRYGIRDISNDDVRNMSGDPIFELLRVYKPVYRELNRFFRKYWCGTLPFSPAELDLEKYVLLTKFVGYNKDFYNALPFSFTENQIEQSFSRTARRLHCANWVPALFETTQLPNIKSVRRIIFSNPAPLFYQKELEAVWEILNDPSFFRAFLESRNLYLELSIFHKYPKIIAFFKELSAAVGQRTLCNYLAKGNDFLHYYALRYLCLNEHEKKLHRKKWSGDFFSKRDYFDDYYDAYLLRSEFSVPIPARKRAADAKTCRIGGYSFARLCNSKEYMTAGEDLCNCLENWKMFIGNVYGVLRGGKYVAAIEIADQSIIQAHTYRNGRIDKDKELFSAFSIWKKRNGLR